MNKPLILFSAAILFLNLRAGAQPGMPGGGRPSDCTPASIYHFKGMMEMQITSVNKNQDTSVSRFNSYFGDSAKTIAMIKETNLGSRSFTMTSIMNLRDSQVITLMDMGTVKFSTCNLNNRTDLRDTTGRQNQNKVRKNADFKNFKETGKTKKICGYTCKEYTLTNEDGTTSIWISEEAKGLGLSHQGSFSPNGATTEYPKGVKGAIMELNRADIKTKSVFQMLVTKVDLNMAKDISTDGYKLR